MLQKFIMKDRLIQFLKEEEISQAQFADSINVARAGISHIVSGRNNPSYEFIVNTMKRYPQLNIEWLLTGKGEMFKNDNSLRIENSEKPVNEAEDTLFSQHNDSRQIAQTQVGPRQISKVILLYSDGTYLVQE